jgi:hypothetical protein
MLFSTLEVVQRKAIQYYCDICPVRRPCLNASLQAPVSWDFGVWGGKTEAERKEIRKAQKAKKAT